MVAEGASKQRMSVRLADGIPIKKRAAILGLPLPHKRPRIHSQSLTASPISGTQ
jgi:hypothetical protein